MNTKLGEKTRHIMLFVFVFHVFFAYQKPGVLEFQEIKQPVTGGQEAPGGCCFGM